MKSFTETRNFKLITILILYFYIKFIETFHMWNKILLIFIWIFKDTHGGGA